MLDDKAVAELESKHGEIAHVKGAKKSDGTPAWEVVYRKPSRQEYRMFKSRLRDPRAAVDAQEELSRRCVVYPAGPEFEALLEKFPAIPEACTEAFMALVGLEVQHSGK